MNKVILLGRLCSDPEFRQTQSGIASCRFTVAVDRKFADKATGKREADFIRCTAWRNTAEFISRYFNKGRMISLEGELRTGSYQDQKYPDVTHYTTEVFVDNAYFCGDKVSVQAQTPDTQNNYQYSAPPQQAAPQQPYGTYGELSDYEEILSDGDTPF